MKTPGRRGRRAADALHAALLSSVLPGVLIALLASHAPPASAQQAAPAAQAPPRDAAPPQPARDPWASPLHGFYVRAGLGFGALGNYVDGAYSDLEQGNPEGTIVGTAFAAEVTITGPVSPTWTFGGGAWNSLVLDAEYTTIGGDIPEGLRRPANISLVGFVADWHFARELGLHAQIGMGAAALQSEEQRFGHDAGTTAFGPGLALGLGADFWVDPSLAFGAMARVTAAAPLQREHGITYEHAVVAPSLLLTVCYNR